MKFKIILIATDFLKVFITVVFQCMQNHTFSIQLGNGSSLGQHQLRFAVQRWSTLSDKEISFPSWRCHFKLQQLRNDWSHCWASDVQQGCPCPPVPLSSFSQSQSKVKTPIWKSLPFSCTLWHLWSLPPSWGDPGSTLTSWEPPQQREKV